MKTKLLVTASLAVTAASSMAATNFIFNEAFSGGISSGLSDAAGLAAVNGLNYGVIIDLDGGPFQTTTYDALPGLPAAGIGTPLTTLNGLATDAVLVMAGDLTADQSFGNAFTDIGGGDHSVGGGVAGVTVNYDAGTAQGQFFQLIWFDAGFDGTGTAGSLASGEFVLPANLGGTFNVDDVFIGPDPVRSATGITFVPEPSAALLGAFGVLGLLRRRRA